MQMLVPSYLEFSIDKLAREQQKFRDQMTNAFGGTPFAEPTRQVFQSLEDQTRKNMQMFRQALAMFNPFALGVRRHGARAEPGRSKNNPSDIEDLRRQLEEMRDRLDGLAKKA